MLPAKLVVSLHLKSNGTNVVRQARAKYPKDSGFSAVTVGWFAKLLSFAVTLKWLHGKESD